MPSTAPSWRKIETALIELLRAECFEFEQDGGYTYITLLQANGSEISINLTDFARELSDRLA